MTDKQMRVMRSFISIVAVAAVVVGPSVATSGGRSAPGDQFVTRGQQRSAMMTVSSTRSIARKWTCPGYQSHRCSTTSMMSSAGGYYPVQQLLAKQVAAVASDQVVLIGQLMQAQDPKAFSSARELFSYEPYGFVVRRNDADFRLVANGALAQLYRNGQIKEVYDRWFSRAGVQPSPVLTAMYVLEALPE
jgi:ABC-type amino acid transport substrate-binding protein